METLKLAAEHIWAIQPPVLEAALERVKAGLPAQAAAKRQAARAGAVAILPLQGVLRQKGSTFMDMLFGDGGPSTERFAANIRRLAADESVGTIVLDVHSPGGEVFGTQEAADAVFEARQQKQIVAVVNSLAASAAYWIASQADEIWASSSSLTGSIGVFAMHEDISEMAEKVGVKVTLISAGKFKTEGNEFEPLTDEAKAAIQSIVDGHYAQFVNAVARGRGVKAADVRGGMGQGRVVGAKDAVALGMADKVGTLRDALAKLGTASDGLQALDDNMEIVAEAPVALAEDDDSWEAQVEQEKWDWLDKQVPAAVE